MTSAGTNSPTDYSTMPVSDQFALVTTEVGRHLLRVQEAARMWREVARQLTEVSESLSRELESVAPHWQDVTGISLLARGLEQKLAVDDWLNRLTEHQPWRALDDLARQLLLTEARMAGAVERAALAAMLPRISGMPGAADCPCPPGSTGEDTGAHLNELDRYFQAAADAELHSAGLESPMDSVADPANGDASASGMPMMSTMPTGPMLAGGPDAGFGPGMAGMPGGSLPPGAVSLPGLLAIPPGAGLAGGRLGSGSGRGRNRGLGSGGSGSGGGASSLGDSSVAGGAGGLGKSGAGGEHGVHSVQQIPHAAHPPKDTGPTPAPDAPEAPDRGEASSSNSAGGAAGAGGFFPPMMMSPMMGGMGRGGSSGSRLGGARTVGGNDRPTRAAPNPTPGVPSRLRGRSGLADPATNGFRSPTSAGQNATTIGQAPQEPLEHEMWNVAEPKSAAQLKADAPEVEPAPRRAVRRAL